MKEKFAKKMKIVIYLALVIVVGGPLLSMFFVSHTTVHGNSMNYILYDNDQVLINRFAKLKRYDIIVFKTGSGECYIKRIVAIPDETVLIKDGKLYINGEESDEKYGLELMNDPGIASEEITLGEDEYFVLGDNRNDSDDSRSLNVGPVEKDRIIGKAFYKIYPIIDIGKIRNDANEKLNNIKE